MDDKVALGFKVDRDLYEAIKAKSEADERSLTRTLIILLRDGLDVSAKEAQALAAARAAMAGQSAA